MWLIAFAAVIGLSSVDRQDLGGSPRDYPDLAAQVVQGFRCIRFYDEEHPSLRDRERVFEATYRDGRQFLTAARNGKLTSEDKNRLYIGWFTVLYEGDGDGTFEWDPQGWPSDDVLLERARDLWGNGRHSTSSMFETDQANDAICGSIGRLEAGQK